MQERPHAAAFRANAWMLGWVLAFSLAVAVLSLTAPLFMLLTYDRVLSARSHETLVALVILAMLCLVGRGILDYARRRVLALFGAALQEVVESDLVALAQAQRRRGAGGGPATAELDELRSFIHSGAALNVIDVLWIPFSVVVVLLLSPALGTVVAVGLAALGLTFAGGSLLSRAAVERADQARARTVDLIARHERTRGRLAGQHVARIYERLWGDARRSARRAVIRARDRTIA